jgi:hypothetical protein
MEADLEHQASSDEDEDEVLPAVSVGDVFMPCGNVIFARVCTHILTHSLEPAY